MNQVYYKYYYIKITEYFHKPCSSYRNMKVKVVLSNYATKSNIKKQHFLIYHHLL